MHAPPIMKQNTFFLKKFGQQIIVKISSGVRAELLLLMEKRVGEIPTRYSPACSLDTF
jgi:hypothetical protein